MINKTSFVLSGLMLLSTTRSGFAEEARGAAGSPGLEAVTGFGAPGSVVEQMAEDDAAKEPAIHFPRIDNALKPWFNWKKKLQQDHGLQLGIAYTSLMQSVSNGPRGAEDSAGSGILRLSGKWELLNPNSKNSGALVVNIDHRGGYTDVTPGDIGFETGYLGIPGALFSDADWLLGEVSWQQSFNDGKTGLVIGRYDPNDFFDVLGYANPWTAFSNAATLFNLSIALPDWSTGIGIGHWFSGEQWYLKAAVNDVNGTADKIKFFENFSELYTTVEVGWSPSMARRFHENFHVMAWHADERNEADIEESKGITIGANWTFDDTWMPFLKAGWSDGAAPLYNESVTVGMIYSLASRSDLFGVAVNWGNPSDQELREQTTTEVFYRFQLAQNLAITPSLQFISDPALNPNENSLTIFSLRVRVTL